MLQRECAGAERQQALWQAALRLAGRLRIGSMQVLRTRHPFIAGSDEAVANFVLLIADGDPVGFFEALQGGGEENFLFFIDHLTDHHGDGIEECADLFQFGGGLCQSALELAQCAANIIMNAPHHG